MPGTVPNTYWDTQQEVLLHAVCEKLALDNLTKKWKYIRLDISRKVWTIQQWHPTLRNDHDRKFKCWQHPLLIFCFCLSLYLEFWLFPWHSEKKWIFYLTRLSHLLVLNPEEGMLSDPVNSGGPPPAEPVTCDPRKELFCIKLNIHMTSIWEEEVHWHFWNLEERVGKKPCLFHLLVLFFPSLSFPLPKMIVCYDF